MTDAQKEQVRYLRCEGLGYGAIATRLGISENTVKSFVRYFREYGQELLPPQQPHRSGFQRAGGGMPELRQAASSIPQEKTEKILLRGLPPRMVEAAPGAYP